MMQKLYQREMQKHMIAELQKEKWLRGEPCAKDMEYMECVYDVLQSPVVQRMNEYIQHGTTTTLKHCLSVSYASYKICKSYGLDYRSAARGGLLHDLFLYDWHEHAKNTGNHFHGFTHPRVALHNANHYFCLNKKEQDIIVKHMWPLTVIPPKTAEGYVVMYADKYCSFLETVCRMKTASLVFLAKMLKIV